MKMNENKITETKITAETHAFVKPDVMLSFCSVGEKIIVIERTYTGEVFEWEGKVTQVTECFIETEHSRNAITHPQWHSFMRAYSKTWTKHYGLTNLKRVEQNGA